MLTVELCGFKVSQRIDSKAVSFFVFSESPKEVIKWSFVDRLADRDGGIQRRLSIARKRALTKYFNDEPSNIIPTNIVLAFSPGATKFIPFEDTELNCVNEVQGVNCLR